MKEAIAEMPFKSMKAFRCCVLEDDYCDEGCGIVIGFFEDGSIGGAPFYVQYLCDNPFEEPLENLGYSVTSSSHADINMKMKIE